MQERAIWHLRQPTTETSTIMSYNNLAMQYLNQRGYALYEDVTGFLDIDIKNLHDPSKLLGMDDAVSRIREAIDRNQRIVIYGDYDVDGVTATALLYHVFKHLAIEVGTYIPDRLSEGYGLNMKAMQELVGQYELMITVDCGIKSYSEIDYAMEHSLDVILTDHHLPDHTLPAAVAVINPQIETNDYPEAILAGVGVAFKLGEALLASYSNLASARKVMQQWIDLVAIGTVADIVPLIGENRIIVAKGLEKLNQNVTLPGLNALIQICKFGNRQITTGQIGFGIGPRLNAGGRVGSARQSLELLTTSDPDQALELAVFLDGQNEKRRFIEKQIEKEAISLVEEDQALHRRFIILYCDHWHHGVLGIVASRLVDRYYRPVILLGGDGDTDVAKGSGRSISGVHLQKHLIKHQDLLLKFGGHAMAIGMSININNLDRLRVLLTQDMEQIADQTIFSPKISIDLVTDLTQLSASNVQTLESLAPFGLGNPRPQVLVKGVEVTGIQKLSAGKHTKLTIAQGENELGCLFWQQGDLAIEQGDYIDLVGTLELNIWQGRTSVNVIGKAWRPNGFSNIFDQRNSENKKKKLLQLLNQTNSVTTAYFYADQDKSREINQQILFNQPLIYNHQTKKFSRFSQLVNIDTDHFVIWGIPTTRHVLRKFNSNKAISLHLLYNRNDYQAQINELTSLSLDKPQLSVIYRYLQSLQAANNSIINLATYSHDQITRDQLLHGLQTFDELRFIKWGCITADVIWFNFAPDVSKQDLSNSTSLTALQDLIKGAKQEYNYLLTASLDELQQHYTRRTSNE